MGKFLPTVVMELDPVALKALQEYTGELSRRVLVANRSAVGAMATVIKRYMKSYAPARTGRLKHSLGIRRSENEGPIHTKYLGARRNYRRSMVARFLEYGTKYMNARPFMARALGAARAEAISAYEARFLQLTIRGEVKDAQADKAAA